MTFQMTPRMRFGCLGALLLLIAVIIAVSLWSREVHSVVTKIEEKSPDREAKLVDKGQEISELKDSSVAGDVSQDRPCNTKGCMPGLIITGGSSTGNKVELYNPVSSSSCVMPDLPDYRAGHYQCGDLICSNSSCLLRNGTTFSSRPLHLRKHITTDLCWSPPGMRGDVLLLGGLYIRGRLSFLTHQTTIVSADGTSARPGWNLPYATIGGCGIEVEDTFIVSGGWDSPDGYPVNNVVEHKENGEVKFLPGLIQGRASHACASYFNEYGKRRGAYYYSRVDTTEVMVIKETSWRQAAKLPSARFALHAVTIDNKVFIFGGKDLNDKVLNAVLLYDSNTWQPAGTMTVPRLNHSVAVFPDVSKLCP